MRYGEKADGELHIPSEDHCSVSLIFHKQIMMAGVLLLEV
jgi:hypothetical protein